MPNRPPGVGLFTAENIAAILKAIPKATARTETSPVRPSNTAAPSTTTPYPTGSTTAGLMLQPANHQPPTPDSPNCTKNWSASTADRTTTGTEKWTKHSRSYNGPVSAAA